MSRPAVFLDYDGTLTPIVDRPEDALISDRMRQAVRRLAPLARRVLQDEVLPGGALHAALGHLHEATDPVLFVDDEVAGAQL